MNAHNNNSSTEQAMYHGMEFYLRHVMHKQQWDGDGGDVVRAAHFQDISEAHDGRVSSCEVGRAHVIIHAQMKHYVNLGQVGMTSDVEFTCRGKKNHHLRL